MNRCRSTVWVAGRRFAHVHRFNGRYIESKNYKDKRLIDYKSLDSHNADEWLKFIDFADKHL